MDRIARGKEKISQKMSMGSDPRHSKSKANPSCVYVQKKLSPNIRDGLLQTGGFCKGEELHDSKGTGFRQDTRIVSHSVHKDDILLSQPESRSSNVQLNEGTMNTRASQTVGLDDGSGLHCELSHKLNIICPKAEDGDDLPQKGRVTNQLSQEKSPRKTMGFHGSRNSEQQAKVDPFDICLINKSTPFTLKPSLFANNREKRNQIKHSIEGQSRRVLRPGMLLLKQFLSLDDQVKIVKVCRDIGLGTGGFYQPGYRDGGKLHLKMMCLGKNWDPETGQYGDFRPIDDAKPPSITPDLLQFVRNAIRDSHALIAKNSANVEDILPWMSPNICIVNFYSLTGRLGLHQDKDESQESLNKGLPVVSFSIGDSAEFLYGDERDVDKADKVLLESGDALLFGGRSRHVFHGVTSVIGKTAPETLLARSNLRPGRLNLTFREY